MCYEERKSIIEYEKYFETIGRVCMLWCVFVNDVFYAVCV